MRGVRAAAAAVALWASAIAASAAAPPVCEPERIALMTEDGPVAFEVEIADTPDEQSRGLMFRPSLADDRGMLFLYERPRIATFWMKNTMIPLDMIFLDATGAVVNIEAEAVPYSLTARRSEAPVVAVLEIRGGLAAELGIAPGTQAVHPAFHEAPEGARCAAD